MPSPILTFANTQTNGAKTGTTIQTFIDDLDTMVTANSANAAFSWQTAGKNSSATSPQWIIFSRKDGSVGRMGFVHYATAPAGVPATIFEITPTTTAVFGINFPFGTANTLSNLTSTSGTICGNDTQAQKARTMGSISLNYVASYVPFYWDSYETLTFCAANPASTTMYMSYLGGIWVDASDTVWPGVWASGGSSSAFGVGFGSTPPMAWSASAVLAGGSTGAASSEYMPGYPFFPAMGPTGNWGSSSAGFMFNTATNDVEICPVPYRPGVSFAGVQAQAKGNPIKLRQMGFGPTSTAPFARFNISGPSVESMQICNTSAGSNGNPWHVNAKI